MISGSQILLVILLFAATLLVLQNSATIHPVSIKQNLSLFPEQLGTWHSVSSIRLSDDVINRLKMDEYINSVYAAPDGRTIHLYVAFYQAVGISGGYHAPVNCLPGSGWGVERVQSLTLPGGPLGRDSTTVSQMVIRKQKSRRVVVYWYQNRGRIIGSEYLEKIYLVLDAVFTGRRDGTLVRLISPVENNNIAASEAAARDFSVLVMQELENFLPGKQE